MNVYEVDMLSGMLGESVTVETSELAVEGTLLHYTQSSRFDHLPALIVLETVDGCRHILRNWRVIRTKGGVSQ